MKTRLLAGFAIAVLVNLVVSAQAPGRGGPAGPPNLGQPPADTPGKIEIIATTGCVRERGAGNWMLVAATDPLVSVANAPARADLPKTPPAGKNTFQLIGVGEFQLPTFKDKTVVVKALYIKAMPVTRLNLTSVVEALPTCAADAPK